MVNLCKVHKRSKFEGVSPETLKLDKETFMEVIQPNIALIARAFRGQFVIPDFQGFNKDIEELYNTGKRNTSGVVASYIPQLAEASADSWGLSVCTVDGQRSSFGDTNKLFTVQSCSKPLTYGMALEALGPELVHRYVGTEHGARSPADALDYNSRGRSSRDDNFSDMLFEMHAHKDLLSIGKFLEALKQNGIRKTDVRIKEIMNNFYKIHKQSNHEGGSPETLQLDRATFKEAIAPNLTLIARAFKSQFIIPDFQDFNREIEKIYRNAKSNKNGAVATYIPQLAKASADSWGVSVCTVDGQRSSIGDVHTPFTMQSCSKALTYGMALEALGPEEVHKYIGTEPSGRNFNELVLDPKFKPHNPMINAGAILICSLLRTLDKPEMTLAEQFDYVMAYFSRIAGREPLGFNNAVYLSEREAADRNYAIGYYMRGFNCFPEKTNFLECMDFYFQCCSMEANAESMSVIAATLANGGICPTTGEKVLHPDAVRNVLSMMHSCGMYDYSGQFAFKVGLPAKSGVSGAMLIVVPEIMGISTYSPPLDVFGNSCRGIQFCEELVTVFNFHMYDNVSTAKKKKDPRRNKFDLVSNNVVSLLFSAANGDVNNLKRHYLSGMHMDVADYDGRTALHLAAAEGHLSCVEFLVNKCKVPTDTKDRWGKTPLNEAETFGHMKVVKFLKESGIPHQVRDKRSTVDKSLDTKFEHNEPCRGCSNCETNCDT